MSLHLDLIGNIPDETAHVARAVFRKGTLAMQLREEFDVPYRDEDFRALIGEGMGESLNNLSNYLGAVSYVGVTTSRSHRVPYMRPQVRGSSGAIRTLWNVGGNWAKQSSMTGPISLRKLRSGEPGGIAARATPVVTSGTLG